MSPARLPGIVLCVPEHADVLTNEFARYARDYAVRSCASAAETSAALRSLVAEGAPIPLLVTESALPDSEIFPAIAEWRSIVPTARRPAASQPVHHGAAVFAAGDVREGSMKRVAVGLRAAPEWTAPARTRPATRSADDGPCQATWRCYSPAFV